MLYQNYSFEQSQNQIFSVLKDLQIAKLLYKANIRKGCGLSALEIFQRLVMLVFHGKNLFRSLESKHNDHAASKSSYYRFLTIRKPTRILTIAPTAGKPGWKA